MPTKVSRQLAGAALVLSVSLSTAHAQTTWHVDVTGTPPGSGSAGNPYTSIQFAIDQGSTVDGDTLLVAPGTYVENVDFSGKTLRLVSSGGAAVTTIDGGTWAISPDLAAVTLASGEGRGALVEGFTITGGLGNLDVTLSFAQGGGVNLIGTSPTIRDCVVSSNEADHGVGLYSEGGSPFVDGCVFLDNDNFSFQTRGGGAHFEGGSPRLRNTRFEDNDVDSFAGGIWFGAVSASLEDCDLLDNSANFGSGGGAYLEDSTVTMSGCTFTGNSSFEENGGAFFVDAGSTAILSGCELVDNFVSNDHTGGGVYVAGSLHFLDGLIAGNESARGGGIACTGTAHVEDSLLCDNVAESFQALDGNGGGVWVDPFGGGATARLVRCVIEGNEAIDLGGTGQGGGVFGAAFLELCTVADNTASNGGGGAFGAFTMTNSVHWGNTPTALGSPVAVTYSDVEGGGAGAGNVASDPLFWNATEGDYHLLLGSPAIDAGDPFSPADPDGSRADMGAYPHEGGYAALHCTSGTSASGCQAVIGSSGVPSATATAGFFLDASNVEAQKDGLFYFGANGRQANPWGTGTSYRCVVPPVKRGTLLAGVGTSGGCDGSFHFDLNALWCPTCAKPGHNPGAGSVVQTQLWYRDPLSTSSVTTSLSAGLEFQVQP